MLFSGDLGPDEKVFHPEPEATVGFDYVICESTYGNRDRQDYTVATRREALRTELVDGLARGGNIVIPAFAVERSQELLHDIGVLLAKREIPPATVFLDSPLARRVTQVFSRHADEFDDIEVERGAAFPRSAFPHRRERGGKQGDQHDRRRRDHHFRFRHVRGRARQASPEEQHLAA